MVSKTSYLVLVFSCVCLGAAGAQPHVLVDSVLVPLAVEDGVDAALTRAGEADPAVLNLLGYRLLHSGHVEESVKVLKTNIERHPDYLNGYDSLAEAYVAAGRRGDAATQYRELLRRLPDAELPQGLGRLLKTNAEFFLYQHEHFAPPSASVMHVASYFGGVPAGKWEMANLSSWSSSAGIEVSFEGHNLYRNPVPQDVAGSVARADVAATFLGGQYRRWIADGTIADITDLWSSEGWEDAFAEPFKQMASVGSKRYFVPTAFQWNPIWYRRDIFYEMGLAPPTTWEELLALCDRLHAEGRAAFSISVSGWTPPAARWFSILNLRLNGPDFHADVMRGAVPFTDPRVRNVFEHWQQLFEHHAFVDSSFANTYQKGISDFVSGKAVMYNLGEWVYESLPAGYDKLDFFAFPVMNPEVERAEIVHAYGAFMRSAGSHDEAARGLVAYLGSAESQAANASELHRINAHRGVDRSLYTDEQQRALAYLSEEVDVFAPLLEFAMQPSLASAALQAFADFWANPQDIDGPIEALEEARVAARN